MSLKVFNLSCEHGHDFEGWFESLEALEKQASLGLIECPHCQTSKVFKTVSVPYFSSSTIKTTKVEPEVNTESPITEEVVAEVFKAIEKAITSAEDVGDGFTDVVIRIHKGEEPARAVRGRASIKQREMLEKEGIATLAYPDFMDPDFKKKLN
ncbi:DUF1178 family protein [Taylorella equigenitalis]|uniref:DUF1178 family protein n=1 Tax=Taylorella equigenitalis TaxID=29575 RepID=UPI0004161672|nr:DUF1178 family protein [Taylorella equigenitalis]ASY37644.1 DUF1178 domain-containing protein [Taylorella equigenitalis]ASY42066.1 hypothetical protein CA943_02865 [Taylorella equigenitalis]KGK33216.1 hypothetical protein LW90_05950 [Taylorella equigenitalis]RBA26379.1 DUF1178 family protein [Taylorella equigenitalis]WDU46932.1 DUF1178 family protein [Taylorella equigenitalis]